MNLGAKGPRETLMVWQERLVFTFLQWDWWLRWTSFPPETGSHLCPRNGCGLWLPLSFGKYYFLIACSLGVEAGALGIETERICEVILLILGLQIGPSSPFLILSSPSEFSPRPRKSVLVSTLNSSYCKVGSAPLGSCFHLEVWSHTLQHPNFRTCRCSWAGLWPGRAVARCLNRLEPGEDLSLWRLVVRTGSLSVAELCLGLGCSEPVAALTTEGNLSGHCLPWGSLVSPGRRKSMFPLLGVPGCWKGGLPPSTPCQDWLSSVYLCVYVLRECELFFN